MPQDRYLPSPTTSLTQVRPERIRQVILGVWLVSAAILAAWMLAALFPLGPSFYLQAPQYASVSVISSPGARSVKGDRLTSEKARERRQIITRAPVSAGELKIPVGCDAAFSHLVKFGNFTARCVT